MSLFVFGLAGCHQSVLPTSEEQGDGCERMVRITAKILPSYSPLRAAGDIQNDPDGKNSPFNPEVVDPNKTLFDEDRIDHVMLYVYDKDKLIKTVFYHDPTITAGMPTAFDGLEVKNFGTEAGGTFTFDLLLTPGQYRFVLLVNDPQCYYEAKNNQIRLPEKIYLGQMTDQRKLFSSQILADGQGIRSEAYKNGTHPRVLPMTGQALLVIPRGPEDGTMTTITPSIDLERIMARIEIILTTANQEKSKYLSPDVAKYKVDNRDYVDGSTSGRYTKGSLVDLVDRDWRAGTLEILPTRGEYTATGRDMPEESRLYSDRTANDYLQYFRDADTYRTAVTTLYAETMDNKDTFISGGGLPMMYQQHSKTSSGGSELQHYYLYIPPMFIDGLKKEDMPYILIGINASGNPIPEGAKAAAEEMTYFRLPITTLVSAAGGGIEEKFEIRRNTTYSIYAAFRGGKLILDDGIKVYPWREEKQTHEINPDDEGVDPIWNQEKP